MHLYYKFRSLFANMVKEVKYQKSIVNDLQQKILEYQNNPLNYLHESFQQIIAISNKNKGRKVGIFSEEDKAVCLRLFLENGKVYKYLVNNKFHIPKRSAIHNYLNEMYEKLPYEAFTTLDPSGTLDVITYWQSIRHTKTVTPCILAIDAICVTSRCELNANGYIGIISHELIEDEVAIHLGELDNFEEFIKFVIDKKINTKAFFVVQLIPLSKEKPYILHFHQDKSGSATIKVYNMLINQIQEIQSKVNDQFLVYGGAADADPQYRSAHSAFRTEYTDLICGDPKNIIQILPQINKLLLFSPDCNHLGKRMKYRAQNDIIKQLFIQEQSISYKEIVIFFEGNEKWYEYNNSKNTKMNDDAVHDFFTPKKILKNI